jgi:hypothetical protein
LLPRRCRATSGCRSTGSSSDSISRNRSRRTATRSARQSWTQLRQPVKRAIGCQPGAGTVMLLRGRLTQPSDSWPRQVRRETPALSARPYRSRESKRSLPGWHGWSRPQTFSSAGMRRSSP